MSAAPRFCGKRACSSSIAALARISFAVTGNSGSPLHVGRSATSVSPPVVCTVSRAPQRSGYAALYTGVALTEILAASAARRARAGPSNEPSVTAPSLKAAATQWCSENLASYSDDGVAWSHRSSAAWYVSTRSAAMASRATRPCKASAASIAGCVCRHDGHGLIEVSRSCHGASGAASTRSGCASGQAATKKPFAPSRICAGPVKPRAASSAASRPASAARPACRCLLIAFSSRNCHKPADCVPALPSAHTVGSSRRSSSRAVAIAAP